MTPDQVLAELAGPGPSAVLVLGAGAGDLLREAATRHGWALYRDLTAATARQARDEAGLAGERVLALDLDGASEPVQNMLLKIVEEPPGSTRFVLAATARPLKTVASRCRVLVLGRDAGGVPAAEAKDVAAVASALRAALAGQAPAVTAAVRGWQPGCPALLGAWAAERVTGRWQLFGPASVPGATARQAAALLAELARYPGAKLGPVVALDRVFIAGS